MATRGADVSILRSTARSIGCEGKRVKDSAADYVPDIWNLYFLSVDDHGKKIYLYCLYFSLCKYERSRSSRNERVLNFKLERYFRKDSRLSYWDRWKNRHQLLPTPIQYIRRPHTSRSNFTDARRSINHRPTLRLSLPSDRTSFVESTLTNPFEACSGDLNNAWKWQFTRVWRNFEIAPFTSDIPFIQRGFCTSPPLRISVSRGWNGKSSFDHRWIDGPILSIMPLKRNNRLATVRASRLTLIREIILN